MIKSLSIITAAMVAGLVVVAEANAERREGLSMNGRNLNGAAREGAVAGKGVQATSVILKDGARVTLK
jgi:hypothetical protein